MIRVAATKGRHWLLLLMLVSGACRNGADRATTPAAERVTERVTERATDHARSRAEGESSRALLALLQRDAALGARATRYRVDRDGVAGAGQLIGRVALQTPMAGDSAIVPSHDLSVCHPFTDSWMPSRDGGVGNAVVWLVGITHGRALTAPRRAALTLDGCQLGPRVLLMAAGGTVLVTSRDAMTSRLRFADVSALDSVRATVAFTDAGQVVPSSAVAARPGILTVRDDWHPWVRGAVVVAPHPYVLVTTATGAFAFDGVPPGRYTLLTWHERLGVRTMPVQITGGVETRVNVAY